MISKQDIVASLLLLAQQREASELLGIDAVYQPAHEVGGDFYRVLDGDVGVDQRDARILLVGDVSGKGLKAAMLVSLVLGALRNTKERRPGRVLEELNHVAMGQTGGGFVTCCCARFDADGTVTLANAGHLSPCLNGVEIAQSDGLPLGIADGLSYEEKYLKLPCGESMMFLSDGVPEAANVSGELFGFDRTREISGKSAREIAEAAKAWGQNDDITVVTVQRAASTHAPRSIGASPCEVRA